MAEKPWGEIPVDLQFEWYQRLARRDHEHCDELVANSQILDAASEHAIFERQQRMSENAQKRLRKNNGGNANRSRKSRSTLNESESHLNVPFEFDLPDDVSHIPFYNHKARAWGNLIGVAEWQQSIDAPAKKPTGWAIRGAQTQENWSKVRPSLATGIVAAECVPEVERVCTTCNRARCVIRCKSCTCQGDGYALLCPACDKAAHPYAHFHQREVWCQGHFKAIPAEEEFDEDGNLQYVGKHFNVRPIMCDNCLTPNTFGRGEHVSTTPLTYIKHGEHLTDRPRPWLIVDCTHEVPRGLHAFQKASFKCGRCAHVQAQNRDDFLRIGAWPATPKKLDCLVSIQLLKRFQRHKFYGAPTSVDAFLKEIHEEGRDEYGVEASPLAKYYSRVNTMTIDYASTPFPGFGTLGILLVMANGACDPPRVLFSWNVEPTTGPHQHPHLQACVFGVRILHGRGASHVWPRRRHRVPGLWTQPTERSLGR
eukprot:9476810-Pyramimonas_sp.AAC.1